MRTQYTLDFLPGKHLCHHLYDTESPPGSHPPHLLGLAAICPPFLRLCSRLEAQHDEEGHRQQNVIRVSLSRATCSSGHAETQHLNSAPSLHLRDERSHPTRLCVVAAGVKWDEKPMVTVEQCWLLQEKHAHSPLVFICLLLFCFSPSPCSSLFLFSG